MHNYNRWARTLRDTDTGYPDELRPVLCDRCHAEAGGIWDDRDEHGWTILCPRCRAEEEREAQEAEDARDHYQEALDMLEDRPSVLVGLSGAEALAVIRDLVAAAQTDSKINRNQRRMYDGRRAVLDLAQTRALMGLPPLAMIP
jgi:hypothetical protein